MRQAASAGFNQDEEASGVLEVSDLLKGVTGYDTNLNRYYLLVDQAHISIPLDPELVEKGQLLLMKVAK